MLVQQQVARAFAVREAFATELPERHLALLYDVMAHTMIQSCKNPLHLADVAMHPNLHLMIMTT